MRGGLAPAKLAHHSSQNFLLMLPSGQEEGQATGSGPKQVGSVHRTWGLSGGFAGHVHDLGLNAEPRSPMFISDAWGKPPDTPWPVLHFWERFT